MKSPKEILDLVRAPEARRYLSVAAGSILLLSVLAVGNPNNLRVTTGDGGTTGVTPGDELAPGETLTPEQAAAEEAARKAASKANSTAKSATGKVGVDTPISDTEIAVGMMYITNPGTANSAAGFTGVGQVNQKRAFEIMTKEVNKNAPFGRKVVPVFYSSTEENAIAKGDQLWQEACAHFTEDNKVFMTWFGGQSDTLQACLTKNRVAQIAQGLGFSYDKTYKDYPWYIEHNASALDRMAEFEVDQLHARGFFAKCRTDPKDTLCVDGQPRIALIRYDQPSYKAAATRMKGALARHGLSLCDGCEFEMTLGATADIPAQLDDGTEVTSAIVNCKGTHTAQGASPGPCTHMLFLGSNSGCRQQIFYARAAEQQEFRVRLGLNALDCGGEYWDSTGNPEYADNQFKQSLLVGHIPGGFGLRTAAWHDCKKLFDEGGETFGGSDDTSNNKEGQIDGYCDTAWYHMAVFNAVGRTINLDTFLNGVANTGVVKSAGAFVMRTTATRHDGAGAVRIGEWDPGECRCHKPVTGDIPV